MDGKIGKYNEFNDSTSNSNEWFGLLNVCVCVCVCVCVSAILYIEDQMSPQA